MQPFRGAPCGDALPAPDVGASNVLAQVSGRAVAAVDNAVPSSGCPGGRAPSGRRDEGREHPRDLRSGRSPCARRPGRACQGTGVAWMRMMGVDSVEYHRQTVLDRSDDYPGSAIAYYAERGESPLTWGGGAAAGLGLEGHVTDEH